MTELGFSGVTGNSLDGVSDRDFVGKVHTYSRVLSLYHLQKIKRVYQSPKAEGAAFHFAFPLCYRPTGLFFKILVKQLWEQLANVINIQLLFLHHQQSCGDILVSPCLSTRLSVKLWFSYDNSIPFDIQWWYFTHVLPRTGLLILGSKGQRSRSHLYFEV